VKDYRLDGRYEVIGASTSRGCQVKYYKDGYWYKVNKYGYENLAEAYSSLLLKYLYPGTYVEYELCTVNGYAACRSRNFLKENETLQTFQHIYEIYHGRKIGNYLMGLKDAGSRYAFVADFMREATGLDLRGYLRRVVNLDLVILNEDRHFDNLAVIYDDLKGVYREAPIFDNGLSLLSDYSKYEPLEDIRELVQRVSAATFSGSFEQQAMAVGLDLIIENAEALREELSQLPEHRCKQVLMYQLDRYHLI